jgi:hypothetical protein
VQGTGWIVLRSDSFSSSSSSKDPPQPDRKIRIAAPRMKKMKDRNSWERWGVVIAESSLVFYPAGCWIEKKRAH